ncbi:hypothetical protein MXB_2548 [Myxobolus squamalis]|nr:hypothetical protein MXB_2548 [Myxobolus squamalis]
MTKLFSLLESSASNRLILQLLLNCVVFLIEHNIIDYQQTNILLQYLNRYEFSITSHNPWLKQHQETEIDSEYNNLIFTIRRALVKHLIS